MNSLLKQRQALDRLTRWVATVGFTGLVAIGLMTMVDAVSRHLMLPRLPGFGDFGEVFFALVIASCFPAGLLHNQNVAVTFLGDALGARGRALLNFLAAFVTLVVFVLIAYQIVLMTLDYQMSGRVTSTILMPIAPWWWITTAIFITCLPVQLWIVVARFYELVSLNLIVDEGPLASTDQLIAGQLVDRQDKPDQGAT
jgi:TRAP-type mannitol/chloroaromatic compound transport system permease small subunit